MNKDFNKEMTYLRDRAVMSAIFNIYDRLENVEKYLEIVDKYIDKMKDN